MELEVIERFKEVENGVQFKRSTLTQTDCLKRIYRGRSTKKLKRVCVLGIYRVCIFCF